ncbi:hypothetical protein A4X13_0g6884 [Tilletia indica]|uniref:Uncharacterized protein n=1 Tax=Tilletia indica TaxID=43049 RepID=A0A177TT08_9BASI|nr:hypothetical protein A4X13_0g6884 [Tilletia indica]
MSFFDALFYYVLGGFTFLPLCIVSLVAYIWYTAEPVDSILDARDAEAKARGRALAEEPGMLWGVNGSSTGEKGSGSTGSGNASAGVDALDLAGGSGSDGRAAVRPSSGGTGGASKFGTSDINNIIDNKGIKDYSEVDVPPSARRLSPAVTTSASGEAGSNSNASASQQLKPYRVGWVTVRRHFDVMPPVQGGAAAATSTTSLPGTAVAVAAVAGGPAAGSESGAERDTTLSSTEKDDDTASIMSNGSGTSQKRGVMSAMYRGILDYRTQRAEARRQRQASTSSKSPDPDLGDGFGSGGGGMGSPANGSSTSLHPISTPASSAKQQTPVAAGRDHYYCMLKGPILYIYSSDDIKNPNTECYAAIDMRGKRVSIYVSGVGDAQGEPEDEVERRETVGEDEDSSDEDEEEVSLPSSAQEKSAGALLGANLGGPSEGSVTAAGKKTRAQSNWRKAQRATIKDGELFVKRNAVRIVSFNANATGGSTASTPYSQWFVFAKSATQLEDWYHSLIHSSWLPKKKAEAGDSAHAGGIGTSDPLGAAFSNLDMVALLASLDSVPDPIPLRWLNAVFGRIFFTVYRTQWLENYIASKMMKKIRRVKTPTFLSNLRVRDVDVGRSPPAFSRPMLKTLTGDGEASMEVAIHYTGQLRITISTDLTISLGSRFKPYTVSLLLAVIIRSLEGNILLMIKPPPSNRLWFGFTAVPKMTVGIEPVVSERKVQWGMVTRLIEGRIKELLTESLVVPNMDDVPFFDTRKLDQRGGVWASAAKQEPNVNAPNQAQPAGSKTEQPSAAPTAKVPPVKSAPITPIGTPLGPSTPAYEVDGNPMADSSAVDIPTSAGGSTVRSRRAQPSRESLSAGSTSGLEQNSSDSLLSMASPANSSAAIAGLRNTLSRDMAANRSASQSQVGDAKSSTRPQSTSSSSSRRRSWLPLGQKQGSGVTTLGGAGGPPLSSMALGHASFVRDGQDGGSMSGTDGQSYTSDTDGNITGSEAGAAPSLRSKSSQSSMSADESGRSGASIPEETDDEGREGDQEDTDAESSFVAELGPQGRNRQLPSVSMLNFDDEIDRTSTPVSGARPAAETPRAKEAMAQQRNEALRRESQRDFPSQDAVEDEESQATPPLLQRENPGAEAPISISPRQVSATSSVDSGLTIPSRTSTRTSDSEQSVKSSLKPDGGYKDYSRPLPVEKSLSQQSVSVSGSSTSDDSPSTPTRREAPPARPHIFEGGRPIYNPNPRPDNATINTLNQSTSMLWNKAKASLADKDSRQAAAKDAKEALKRGWANWNAKRAESKAIANQTAPGMVPPSQGQDGLWRNGSGSFKDYSGGRSSSGSGDQHSEASNSNNAWFASSPPDPAALGLGIDGGSSSQGEYHRDRTSSMRSGKAESFSSETGRPAYRDYLATKYRDGRSAGGGGSETSSLRSASSPNKAPASGGVEATLEMPSSSSPAAWDAPVPTLAPPAPIARADSDELEGAKASKATDVPSSLGLGSSPSTHLRAAVPTIRRNPSSGSGPGAPTTAGADELSFVPAGPHPTTSLAAGSILDEPLTLAALSPPLLAATASPSITAPAPATLADPERDQRRIRKESTSAPAPVRMPSASPSVKEAAEESASDAPTPAAPAQPASMTTPVMPAIDRVPSGGSASGGYGRTSSGTPGAGVRTQPPRAAMMAIPGIPATQKSEPQSFSAPPREDSVTTSAAQPSLSASLNVLKKWAPGSGTTATPSSTMEPGTSLEPASNLSETSKGDVSLPEDVSKSSGTAASSETPFSSTGATAAHDDVQHDTSS